MLEFSARTGGVPCLSIYAKRVFYLMREEDGKLVLICLLSKNYSRGIR